VRSTPHERKKGARLDAFFFWGDAAYREFRNRLKQKERLVRLYFHAFLSCLTLGITFLSNRKFGLMSYTVPAGWAEQKLADGVVFKLADLPAGEHLAAQIMSRFGQRAASRFHTAIRLVSRPNFICHTSFKLEISPCRIFS
jgi:hypothetical protein